MIEKIKNSEAPEKKSGRLARIKETVQDHKAETVAVALLTVIFLINNQAEIAAVTGQLDQGLIKHAVENYIQGLQENIPADKLQFRLETIQMFVAWMSLHLEIMFDSGLAHTGALTFVLLFIHTLRQFTKKTANNSNESSANVELKTSDEKALEEIRLRIGETYESNLEPATVDTPASLDYLTVEESK